MFYEVVRRCQGMADGIVFLYEEVEKNNGVFKEGIRMSKKGSNIFAVVYRDNLEEIFGVPLPVDDVCKYIVQMADKELAVDIPTKDLQTWEYVKGRIRKKVVNYEKNQARLQCMVHRRYLDLAEVCYMLIDVDERSAYAEIQTHMVTDYWNVTEEEIFKMAEKNMEMEGYHIQSLCQMLGLDVAEMPDTPPLYIITNKAGELDGCS